jgi:hypothetical protein
VDRQTDRQTDTTKPIVAFENFAKKPKNVLLLPNNMWVGGVGWGGVGNNREVGGCAYIHTYIHLYIHTYIHTYTHTYIHTFF